MLEKKANERKESVSRDSGSLRVLSDRITLSQEATMKLKVLVSPETEGGFSVSVPALPGCYSQGETLEEALSNIREAAELWLEVAARV